MSHTVRFELFLCVYNPCALQFSGCTAHHHQLIVTVAINFYTRYHPREEQFRLGTLLECCEAKKDKWLDEYVTRMRKHEAKAGAVGSDDCFISELARQRQSDDSIKLIPAALKRESDDQVAVVIRDARVVEAICALVNYDGRLAQSKTLQKLILRASSSARDTSTPAKDGTDSGSSPAADASPSTQITLCIENLIPTMYVSSSVLRAPESDCECSS